MSAASPPTQLLLRNVGRLTGSNALFVGVPIDPVVSETLAKRHGTLVAFDYAAFLLHRARLKSLPVGLRPIFAPTCDLEPKCDMAIIYLQKGGELNEFTVAMVGATTAPGASVFLVGENKAGIRSNRDVLERRIGPIVFSDAARHSVLFESRHDNVSADPVDLRSWAREFVVDVCAEQLRVASLPGVFSHGRLDEGTQFLLSHLPDGLCGEVLDFGCGSGVIGAAVKLRFPECSLTLVDSNVFALKAAALTFEINGLGPAVIQPANVFDGVTGAFDRILSNPPFHQGIATNYDIVEAFFRGCQEHLRPGGEVVIVANKFLPYEAVMAKAISAPTVVAQNQKYKILASRKRP